MLYKAGLTDAPRDNIFAITWLVCVRTWIVAACLLCIYAIQSHCHR